MSPPIATLSPTIAIRPPTSAAVNMASTTSSTPSTNSKYPDVSLSSLSSSGSSTTAMSITSSSCFTSFMMQQSQPATTNPASIDFGLPVDSFPQSSLFLSTSPSTGANSAGFLCSSNCHGDDFFCLNDIAMNSSSAANTRHNSVSSNGFLDSIFHYGNTSTGGSENGYQLFSSSGSTGASLNVLIDPDLNDENYEEDEGDVDTDESIVKTKSNRCEPLKKTSQDNSSETLIAIRDMAIRDKQQRKHKTSTSSASSMSRSSTIKKFAMELQNTANMAAASSSLSLNHSYHYHPYNPPTNGAYQHSFDLFVDDCVESPHEMSGEGFLDSIIDQHDFVDFLALDDWEQMLDEDRISRLTADFSVTNTNQAAKMEPSNENPSLNKPLVVSINTPTVTATSTINPVIITKTESSSFLEKTQLVKPNIKHSKVVMNKIGGETKLKLPIVKQTNTSNNASRSQTPSSLTSSNSTSSSSLIDNCEFSECINPDDIFPYRRHPFRLSCSSTNGAPSLGHDTSILSHDHHLTVKQQLFNSSSDDEDDDDEEEIDVVSVNSNSKPTGANSLTAFISPQPIKTSLNHNHHNYFTPISKKQNHQTTVVVASNKVKSEPMSVGETTTIVTKCSSAKKQQVTMTSANKTSPIFSKQISNPVVSSVKKQNGSMTPKVEVIKTTKLGTTTIHNTSPAQSVVINSPKSSVIAKSATTTLIKSNSSPLLPQNHQSIVTIDQQQHHQPRKTAQLNSSKNNPQPTTVATTKLIHNHGNGSIRILTTPSSQTTTHHNSPVRSIIQHTKLVTTTSSTSSSSASPLGSTASKPTSNSLTWPTTITTTGRKMTPAATNPTLTGNNKCIVNLDGDLKPLLKTEPTETTAKPLPGQNRPSTDEFESDCYDSDDDEEETDEDTDESDDDDGESSSCSSSPSTMTTASSSCSTPTKTKSKDVGSNQLAGKKKGSKTGNGQRAKQLLAFASTLQSSQTSSTTGASSTKRGHRLSSFVYSSDTPAEKRAFHILSERQRRNDLKKLFETLRTHIPTLSDKQKASKLTILKAAVDHLVEVTIKSNRLASTYDKEKSRNEQLLAHLKSLQSAPASNVSTSSNNSQLGFTLNYHHHRATAATTTAATTTTPNPTLTAVH